jgi:predicted TIM-barrel fold metal-dependent hydrolase
MNTDIRYGILTGYFYPSMLKTQREFATALASAYNDFMIENWLEKDDRFLGSIQIAPQDPLSAAQEIDRLGSHPRMIQVSCLLILKHMAILTINRYLKLHKETI